MKFTDLLWWFLDGYKSSAEIIREKSQPVQQVFHIKTEEASIDVEVDDCDCQEQKELFN